MQKHHFPNNSSEKIGTNRNQATENNSTNKKLKSSFEPKHTYRSAKRQIECIMNRANRHERVNNQFIT